VTTSYTEIAYFVASLLFILGLRDLRSPETGRRGVRLAESAMLIAVSATLLHNH